MLFYEFNHIYFILISNIYSCRHFFAIIISWQVIIFIPYVVVFVRVLDSDYMYVTDPIIMLMAFIIVFFNELFSLFSSGRHSIFYGI
ncbi:hypothetical protein SAMN05444422_10129 [Halobiforma haloterrestris]|uniref:Uncharacterized protein n=1 Tax=Natronobacterium haloterrestre TaxID=148448 RepID=A0A1I1D2N6_NATHA|nr:hypothetical protein SAMN05444422_10129 [Halobiforma haloterrestris]